MGRLLALALCLAFEGHRLPDALHVHLKQSSLTHPVETTLINKNRGMIPNLIRAVRFIRAKEIFFTQSH